MTSKKILTIIYLNRSIALSKVSFSGKTANVSNYSEFALPEGTVENAIVYDPRTVSGIVKEYINAVGFKQIDKTVACIPDNKVKIIFYNYNQELSESQNEDELTNLVETQMGVAMPQLSVIADTYTVRNNTYTIVYAIKREILDPYLTASRFGASIYPASLVLSQALSKNLNEPTIVVYPRGGSLRFFIWSDGHVITNSVDGKNVLDIDSNLVLGLREIITYGESFVQTPIKKVLFVEGKKVSKGDIEQYLVGGESSFETEFFRTKDATLDQYKFLALKGLIKKINDTGLEKPSIKKRILTEKNKSNLVGPGYVKSNHLKIALLSTFIVALLVGLVIAVAWTYFIQNQRKVSDTVTASTLTTTPVITTTNPTISINSITFTPTPTIILTTVPSINTATPATTTVQVLNGTGTKGQAGDVANIIKSIGFNNIKTGDKPPYTTQKTVVNYAPGYSSMADMIVNKLQGQYPLIYKNPVTSQDSNIVVITGNR